MDGSERTTGNIDNIILISVFIRTYGFLLSVLIHGMIVKCITSCKRLRCFGVIVVSAIPKKSRQKTAAFTVIMQGTATLYQD
jgi:hypothetical protein